MRGQYTANQYTPDQLSSMSAEEFLKVCGSAFTTLASGQIKTDKLFCGNLALTKLPDLTNVVVTEDFQCCFNQLKDLSGCPKIYRDFRCDGNQIESLYGAPQDIAGNFWCSNNKLKTLEGGPREVGGHYWCQGNDDLVSLKGAPKRIGGDFSCIGNKNTSLEHGPWAVGGQVAISRSSVITLDFFPEHISDRISFDERQMDIFSKEFAAAGLDIRDYMSQREDTYYLSQGGLSTFAAARASKAEDAARYQDTLKIIKRNQATFRFKR